MTSVFGKIIRWIIVLLVTPILPIWIICLLPNFIFRFIVIKCAKYFRPDLGAILATESAIFAADDLYGKPKTNIVFGLIFKGEKELEELKLDFISGAISAKSANGQDQLKYPELQQCISSFCFFPFWKWDKDFHIDNHIKQYKGPALTSDTLNEMCSRYVETPFVRTRSPWELILFPTCSKLNPGDTDEQKFAILLRIHHTVADGFAIMKLLKSAIYKESVNLMVTPTHPKMRFCEKVIFLLTVPFELVNAVLEGMDFNECRLPESKFSDTNRLVFSERIPMHYIQNIRNIYGVSFTSVLLAGLTGAVRSFMLENKFKIPEAIHTVSPFPIPGHPDKLRNHVAGCCIRLPVGLASPTERILEIEKDFKKLKRSKLPLAHFYLMTIAGSLPVYFFRPFTKQLYSTTVFTNFPGPQEQAFYNGQPQEDMVITVGAIGVGFVLTCISYNGNIRIQAAFNEALSKINLPKTYIMGKLQEELQILIENQSQFVSNLVPDV